MGVVCRRSRAGWSVRDVRCAVTETGSLGVSGRGRRRRRCRTSGYREVGVRFAFYGRMSTREFQHRETSLAWQREVAEATISGRGVVVEEFFDEGCSRRASWWKRPAAAALLAAAGSSDCGFDAVIVGEYERAFCGNQFREVMAALGECGIQLWLPEADGPVDLADPEHRALMVLLGAQSRREAVRSRHRVLAAMRTQACEQGRFLGGRPPYGYRLADAGPHPIAEHARWGRRLHQLEPDPVTGSWVRWIFEQRAAGRSIAGIARELNDRGVVCPSGADPGRNRHRSGRAWRTPTVAGILENPRYTGRQVWNRTGTTGSPGAARRAGGTGRRTDSGEWVVSTAPAHAALVDEETFRSVQGIRSVRQSRDGGTRTYLLSGFVVCGACDRRLDSHWAHNRPGYRCRHGRTSARAEAPGLKSVYVREEHLLDGLRSQLPEVTGDADVVDHLRANGLVIVYLGPDWMLERIEPEAVTTALPPSGTQLAFPVC
ncbi:recombinase family protein [Saccharopolyspora dendranthemae]|nr:recombinase family protein [Saccharopolyspora dendranthemae]